MKVQDEGKEKPRLFWYILKIKTVEYRIPSNNIRGYCRIFPFFSAEIIRGRTLLEGGHY